VTAQRNPWLVLVLVCMAQFMVVLDATIVNVALPSIQKDLAMSEADLQWIVNAYALMFGGFLLLGGRAGDLLGRKRVFLVGVVVFTFASLLNGLAPSSEILIVFRGLQGLGAAMIAPAAPMKYCATRRIQASVSLRKNASRNTSPRSRHGAALPNWSPILLG